jgi:hypothetical protein
MPEGAPRPDTAERTQIWRVAVVAYRDLRRAGASHQTAADAATRALQAVCPHLSWDEADAEAVNAVSFASSFHPEWFWKGVEAGSS